MNLFTKVKERIVARKKKQIKEPKTNNLITIPDKVGSTQMVPRSKYTPAAIITDVVDLTMPRTFDGDRYIALNNYRRLINQDEEWKTFIYFRALELAGVIYAEIRTTTCGEVRIWKPTELFEQFFVENPNNGRMGLRVTRIPELWENYGETIYHKKEEAIKEREVQYYGEYDE